MRTLTVICITLALAALMPAASATGTSEVSFDLSGAHNTGTLSSTYELNQSGSDGSAVDMLGNHVVTWASPVKLAADAPYHNGTFDLDLYFAHAEGGLIANFGSVDDNGQNFQILAHSAAGIVGAIPPVESPVFIPQNIVTPGHAVVHMTGITGKIPAHRHVAINLKTTGDNTLYTAPGALKAANPSTATVPMPELPAIALMGIGVSVIGVAGIVRSRRNVQ